MHKWEYTSVLSSEVNIKSGKDRIPDAMQLYRNVQGQLNSLGNQGWELVSAVPIIGIISPENGSATKQLLYILKRPKPL